MSKAYDDAMEERYEREVTAHVASECGITLEALENHPFQIEENVASGVTISWRVLWDDSAPEGVEVHGRPGDLWTNVGILYQPDEPGGPED